MKKKFPHFSKHLVTFILLPLICFGSGQVLASHTPDRAALLINFRSGKIIYRTNSRFLLKSWKNVGSLIKPFALVAASRSGIDLGSFKIFCPKSTTNSPLFESCWHRIGHGDVDATTSIGYSCNRYYYMLAEYIDKQIMEEVLHAYRIWPMNENIRNKDIRMVCSGIENGCPAHPANILMGLHNLITHGREYWIENIHGEIISGEPTMMNSSLRSIIRNGMRIASLEGTASDVIKKEGINKSLLVKTGTIGAESYGGHRVSWRTDGYCIVFTDEPDPEYGILVFVRDGRGGTSGIKYALSVARINGVIRGK